MLYFVFGCFTWFAFFEAWEESYLQVMLFFLALPSIFLSVRASTGKQGNFLLWFSFPGLIIYFLLSSVWPERLYLFLGTSLVAFAGFFSSFLDVRSSNNKKTKN